MVGLVAAAASSGVILLFGLGSGLGGGEYIGGFGVIPHVVAVVWLIALALVASLWTTALINAGGILARFGLVATGLMGATLGLRLLGTPSLVQAVTDATARPSMPAFVIGGVACVIAGIVSAVMPTDIIRRAGPWFFALAAAPFTIALVVYATAGNHRFLVSEAFVAARHTDWPSEISTRGLAGLAVVDAGLAGIALAYLLLLWQVVEGARAVRDGGVWLSGRPSNATRALTLVLGLKLVWMALGYTGLLGAVSPDHSVTWSRSSHDGPVSWALALAVAAVIGVWLMRAEPDHLHERGYAKGAWLIIGVVSIVPISSVLASPILSVADVLPSGAVSNDLARFASWIVSIQPWLLVGVVYAVVLAGVVLVLLPGRERTSTGSVLLIFGIWGLPRAIAMTSDLLRYPMLAAGLGGLGGIGDYAESGEPAVGWVDPVTLDAAITLVVTLFVVGAWAERRERADARTLLVVLLASTILAHAAAIVPAVFRSGFAFYLGLVVPVAYAFAADAQDLNDGTRRTGRVPLVVGAALLALSATSLLVANGAVRPGGVSFATFGVSFFQPPLVLAILGVTIAAARVRATAGPTPPAPSPLPPAPGSTPVLPLPPGSMT